MTTYTTYESPLGTLLLVAEDGVIVRLALPGATPKTSWKRDDASFAEARKQLADYFAGKRRDFDLPLAPRGTKFEMKVWSALRKIPYGETVSYGDIARAIGNPHGARAVGQANGRNPIAIVVPCHRVIASGGKIGGYGGGVPAKRKLLALEQGVA